MASDKDQLAIRHAEDAAIERPCSPPVGAKGDWGAEANSLIRALSGRVSDLESDLATVRRNARARIAELERENAEWTQGSTLRDTMMMKHAKERDEANERAKVLTALLREAVEALREMDSALIDSDGALPPDEYVDLPTVQASLFINARALAARIEKEIGQ